MRRDLNEPPRACLALAVMWQPQGLSIDEALRALHVFGPTCEKSPVFDFSFTGYYAPEMGQGLHKVFIGIDGFVDRDRLPAHKAEAVEIEAAFLKGGSRLLNVDPMLITSENVVVASSKNFPHRIYLGQGVYGDLALVRRKGRFEALPWTYADYKAQLVFFESVFSRVCGATIPR